jgi:hypothetical protein
MGLMKLFSHKEDDRTAVVASEAPIATPVPIEERVASEILQQEDRLDVLLGICNRLPSNLVWWLIRRIEGENNTKPRVEVFISHYTDLSLDMLPADLVIWENRDPEINEIVEVYYRENDEYYTSYFKVLKTNLKEGTLLLQHPLHPERRVEIGINNIGNVVKIIKYNDPDWKKLVQVLGINYDIADLISDVEGSIEYVRNDKNFYNKENTLMKLETRLEEVNKDISVQTHFRNIRKEPYKFEQACLVGYQ